MFNTEKRDRLPLGAILRDEKTGCVYFVIKIDYFPMNVAYNLVLILDPRELDQTLPLTFHSIIGNDKASKLSVLNTDPVIQKDGSLIHKLSLFDMEELEKYSSNVDFMLRFLTASHYFNKDNHLYEVLRVDPNQKKASLLRKAPWLIKLATKSSYLVEDVSWFRLLRDFYPLVPKNVDEKQYLKSIAANCHFAIKQ